MMEGRFAGQSSRHPVWNGVNYEVSPHTRAYKMGSPYAGRGATVAEGLNCTYFRRTDGTFYCINNIGG